MTKWNGLLLSLHVDDWIQENLYFLGEYEKAELTSIKQFLNHDSIFIDIGAKDKDEVGKMGVHVGCVITYPDTFHILNKDKFVCRAMDNRMGDS